MFEHIRADIMRQYKSSRPLGIVALVRLSWNSPGLQALIVYRLGRWLDTASRNPLRFPILILMPVYWLLVAYVRLAFDIHLHQTACIGPGLYVGHFGGIRVRNCRIGDHCSIQQEVCLEPAATGADGPVIGNRVWIGAHAKIQGDINVGDGATVGAGTVVTQDLEEGCLLLGNPARVLSRNYDNSGFL